MNSALIVEDDRAIQALLKKILVTKFDFTVHQALNGVEGLKILKEVVPDVILLDHSMPRMDGLEFLQAIKKRTDYRNIPVLVISANKESNVVREMISLGVDDYILKPINPEQTHDRLKKVLAGKENK